MAQRTQGPTFWAETFQSEIDSALESRLRLVASCARHPAFLLDPDYRIVYANPPACEFMGSTSDDLTNLSFSEMLGEDWKGFLPQPGYQSGHFMLDPGPRRVQCTFHAWQHLVQKRTLVVLEHAQDTGIRRFPDGDHDAGMEERLFAEIFQDAPVSMCFLRGNEHVLYKANAAYDRLISRKDYLGKPVREVFPELEGQGWFELLDHVYETGETIAQDEKIVRFRTADGGTAESYLNFIYQPVRNKSGQTYGIFYFGVDVTEQVDARKRIEESERRYRQIVETAQEGIWLLDAEHRTLFVNRKMCQILGYEPHEMIGQRIIRFIDSADRDSLERIERTLKTPTASSLEVRFKSSTGRTVWTSLSTTINTNSDGGYVGFLAMVTDITERKKADEELKKLSLIARSTTNAIMITSPSRTIEWVNEAFSRMTGYSLNELSGESPSILFGPDTDEQTRRYIDAQIQRREPYACEIRKYRKDGSTFWVEIQGRPVFAEDGSLSYYFNMDNDITGRRAAYEQLLKAESHVRIFARQLNSMLEDERSRIAREIHDEFGQQLMGLKMTLSYLETLEDLPERGASVIREMLSGLESTFASLRNFANELRPGILDTLGLASSIEWLGRSFEKKSGVACRTIIKSSRQVFDRELSIAYFRICQEALTNVAKHAQATEVSIRLVENAGELMLEVSDNGRGMLSEKVENPFSLGLLGMQERARLIGGQLTINSTPNRGTQIQLTTKTDGFDEDINRG